MTPVLTAVLVVAALLMLQLALSPGFSFRGALPETIAGFLMNPLVGDVSFSTLLTLVVAFLAALWVVRIKRTSSGRLTVRNEVEEGYHYASPEAFEWRRFWRARIENAQDQDRAAVVSQVGASKTNSDGARQPTDPSIKLEVNASQLSGSGVAALAIPTETRLQDLKTRPAPESLLEDVSLVPMPEPLDRGKELDDVALRTHRHEALEEPAAWDYDTRVSDVEQEVVVTDDSMQGELSKETGYPSISPRDLEEASSVAQTPDLLRQVLTAGRLVYVLPPDTLPPLVRAESSIAAVTTLLEDTRSFCLVGPQGAGKMTVLNAALVRGAVKHLAVQTEEGSTSLLLSLLPERSARGAEAKRHLQDLLTMIPRLAGLGYRYVVVYDVHRLPPEDVQKLVRACFATGSLRIAATSVPEISLDGVEILSRAYSMHDLRWIAFSDALHRGLILEQAAEVHLAEYAAARNQADTVEEIVRRLPSGSMDDVVNTIQLTECDVRKSTLEAFTRPESTTYQWFIGQGHGVTVAELRQHFFDASKQIDQPGTDWTFRQFMRKLRTLGFEMRQAPDPAEAIDGSLGGGQTYERRTGSPRLRTDFTQ